MIGFTLPVTVYDDLGNDTRETVLLSLDMDSVPDLERPALDVRLARTDDIIVTCTVQDAYEAIYEIKNQLSEWERQLAKAALA